MPRVCCGARSRAPRAPSRRTSFGRAPGGAGPTGLWARFDAAVAALNRAITGSDAAAVADAFGELADAAGALADAVASEDEAQPRPAARDAA